MSIKNVEQHQMICPYIYTQLEAQKEKKREEREWERRIIWRINGWEFWNLEQEVENTKINKQNPNPTPAHLAEARIFASQNKIQKKNLREHQGKKDTLHTKEKGGEIMRRTSCLKPHK